MVPERDQMKHQLTQDERSRGGKTTASKYDMRERGTRGLQAFANNHFHGDIKRAGYALHRIGIWKTDPVPENSAFMLPSWLPLALRERIGAPVPHFEQVPF